MNIVIIGGGKVAQHLILKISQTEHTIVQLYNRTPLHIKKFATQYEITDDIQSIRLDADMYIVAIKDDSIESFANAIHIKDKIVVHTAGNKSIELLANMSSNYGILYPFQSFSLDIPVDFKSIPIIIEANNAKTLGSIRNLSESISNKVVDMEESKRKLLNVTGVFVNNFTNSIYCQMEKLLVKNEIDFSLLLPLIEYSVEKLKVTSPQNLQTGPAIRYDYKTIENQKKLLSTHPELLKIYSLFTTLIQKK